MKFSWLAFFLLATGVLGSCSVGEGSEVGPKLSRAATTSLTGLVLDQDGKPVVGVVVTIENSGSRALTRRNGRFRLDDPPRGSRVLKLDGANATADASDRFGTWEQGVEVAEGRRGLVLPIVLPDLDEGTGKTLTLGVQTAATSIDDSSGSGGILTIAAGTQISRSGHSGSQRVDLVEAKANAFPVALPAVSGALHAGNGVWIFPVDLSFGAGVGLSMANDLGLPAGARAELYRLAPGAKEWVLAGSGTVQAGGSRILLDSALLPGGGLYVFATEVSQTALVTGRIVNHSGAPLKGAVLVGPGGRSGVSDANGSVQLSGLPRVDGAGTPVTASFVLVGGLGLEPARSTFSTLLSGTTVGLGDKSLGASRVGRVRILTAFRGRALTTGVSQIGVRGHGGARFFPIPSSSSLDLEDLPSEDLGVWIRWVDGDRFFQGITFGIPDPGLNSLDLRNLVVETQLRPAEFFGRMQARVVDEESGAPIRDATVQGRMDKNTGDKGTTDGTGYLLVGGEQNGIATASAKTQTPSGSTVEAAMSLVTVNNNQVQFPLAMAKEPRLGSYDPFLVLKGSLTGGAGSGKTRKVLVRVRERRGDYWDRVLGGDNLAGDLPRWVDPEVTGGTSYHLGIPEILARVTGVEGSMASSVFMPERLGVLQDLEGNLGEALSKDLALSHLVDQSLTLVAPKNLDAAFGPSDLRYELGASFGGAVALSLLPESGGVSKSGEDYLIPVPKREGILAGSQYLLSLHASNSSGGQSSEQRLLLEGGARIEGKDFLPIPVIQAPTHGSTLSKVSPVDVSWSQVTGADFLLLTIDSVSGSDRRHWKVFLPGTATSFQFQALVSGAPELLVSGRTYTLSLEAWRLGSGVAYQKGDGYQRLLGNLFSLRPGDRGGEAMSRKTIQFTLP
ncbi:MAG TPA: carboxypeptidase regulatory-like domain-containing protein [Planctomycetes bacterium]|nr:carboxypeptidase regulatory-like domain-containing protein [Planctomycetota bacterium]